jgi:hypothetical protein
MAFGLSGLAGQQRPAGKFHLTTQGKRTVLNGELAKTQTAFTNPIL